jgi:hypothetical protein
MDSFVERDDQMTVRRGELIPKLNILTLLETTDQRATKASDANRHETKTGA